MNKDQHMMERGGRTFIFDLLRKKYVVATPEEQVRQQFLHYLISDLKYPKGLISVESGLVYNNRQKRTDVVVYDTSGKPYLLAECKRREARLSKEVIYQLAAYNRELNARLLVLTNGAEMICLAIDQEQNRLVPLTEIPAYESNKG